MLSIIADVLSKIYKYNECTNSIENEITAFQLPIDQELQGNNNISETEAYITMGENTTFRNRKEIHRNIL